MFEINMHIPYGSQRVKNWFINDKCDSYMHRDGEIVKSAPEYWPTRELAQAVLDKYQPPHVWKHGDVFEACGNPQFPMIYIQFPDESPSVIHLRHFCRDGGLKALGDDIKKCYLKNATFLFNIREKL